MARCTGKHLYVHVPFCRSKCHYCDFHSLAIGQSHLSSADAAKNSLLDMGPGDMTAKGAAADARADSLQQVWVNCWLAGLELEMKKRGISGTFDTVYIGGGTPTAIGPERFEKLLFMLSPFSSDAIEYSCEVNPESMCSEMAELINKYGINRVSVGVQSFDDHTLDIIGRAHDRNTALKAVALLRDAGIGNINIDIMLGLPFRLTGNGGKLSRHELEPGNNGRLSRHELGPADTIVDDTIKYLKIVKPEHLSLYYLEIPPGSVIEQAVNDRTLQLPGENQIIAAAIRLRQYLYDTGFVRYEISNYAKPGRECRHNLNVWQSGQYTGIGPSACSYRNGWRRKNCQMFEWLKEMNGQQSQKAKAFESERLTGENKAAEAAMLALRTAKGLDIDEFVSRYGQDYLLKYRPKIFRLQKKGLLQVDDNNICIPEHCMDMANEIFCELLP